MPRADFNAMRGVVSAIECVASLPSYRDAVLERSPSIARADYGPVGAFMGYDFHLSDQGPKLIEVNTNAGGAFLNAMLARAQISCCREIGDPLDVAGPGGLESKVASMFRTEWKRQRGEAPMGTIAIVDDNPVEQYLYPEFVLAHQMLRSAGLQAEIAAAEHLTYEGGRLHAGALEVGVVYNRLVDLELASREHVNRSGFAGGSNFQIGWSHDEQNDEQVLPRSTRPSRAGRASYGRIT